MFHQADTCVVKISAVHLLLVALLVRIYILDEVVRVILPIRLQLACPRFLRKLKDNMATWLFYCAPRMLPSTSFSYSRTHTVAISIVIYPYLDLVLSTMTAFHVAHMLSNVPRASSMSVSDSENSSYNANLPTELREDESDKCSLYSGASASPTPAKGDSFQHRCFQKMLCLKDSISNTLQSLWL